MSSFSTFYQSTNYRFAYEHVLETVFSIFDPNTMSGAPLRCTMWLFDFRRMDLFYLHSMSIQSFICFAKSEWELEFFGKRVPMGDKTCLTEALRIKSTALDANATPAWDAMTAQHNTVCRKGIFLANIDKWVAYHIYRFHKSNELYVARLVCEYRFFSLHETWWKWRLSCIFLVFESHMTELTCEDAGCWSFGLHRGSELTMQWANVYWEIRFRSF
jgi:hypothetical protein